MNRKLSLKNKTILQPIKELDEVKSPVINDNTKEYNIEQYNVKDYLINEIETQKNDASFSFESFTSKYDVNVGSLFGLDANKTRLLFNNESSIRKVYVLFDSRFTTKINIDRTVFTWNFQNDNNTFSGETINAIGPIRDVTSFKIFDFFLTLNNSDYWNDQMLMTVFMPEFQAQSFLAPEKRRFHFAGKIWSNNGIVATPKYQISFRKKSDVTGYFQSLFIAADGNDGIFECQKPITNINTISLSFGSPYQLVSIPQDTFSFTIPVKLNPNDILTSINHNIVSGIDRVYITEFVTDDPVADEKLTSLMLRPPSGFPYVAQPTAINTLLIFSPNNVTPAVTFPTMIGNLLRATIYLDYYRFYVPMEISYKTTLNDL